VVGDLFSIHEILDFIPSITKRKKRRKRKKKERKGKGREKKERKEGREGEKEEGRRDGGREGGRKVTKALNTITLQNRFKGMNLGTCQYAEHNKLSVLLSLDV
jgi:hypothetical protein